jgi:hypothetical protein
MRVSVVRALADARRRTALTGAPEDRIDQVVDDRMGRTGDADRAAG